MLRFSQKFILCYAFLFLRAQSLKYMLRIIFSLLCYVVTGAQNYVTQLLGIKKESVTYISLLLLAWAGDASVRNISLAGLPVEHHVSTVCPHVTYTTSCAEGSSGNLKRNIFL